MKCLLAPRSRCWGNCQARQAGITHYQKYKMFNFAFWWNSCSGLWSGPNCAGTCLPPGNSGCWQGGEPGAHTHQTSQDRLGSVIRPMSTSQHSTLNTQHSTLNTQHSTHRKLESESSEPAVSGVVWPVDLWLWEDDHLTSSQSPSLVPVHPVSTLSLDNPWQLHQGSAHHKNWWDHIWYFSVLPVVSPPGSKVLPAWPVCPSVGLMLWAG